jgi:hypothetical protein
MRKLLKKFNKRSAREESEAAGVDSPSPSPSRAATPPRPERFGLFRLDEPSSSANESGDRHGLFPVNIIAVHGLNGDAYSTWTHPNGTLWLRDLLPNFLPGCRVYTYGYPSQVVFNRSYADVSAYARRLLNSIRGLWEEWAEVRLRHFQGKCLWSNHPGWLTLRGSLQASRSIIFICHSLGGIVVKQVSRPPPLLFLLAPLNST